MLSHFHFIPRSRSELDLLCKTIVAVVGPLAVSHQTLVLLGVLLESQFGNGLEQTTEKKVS